MKGFPFACIEDLLRDMSRRKTCAGCDYIVRAIPSDPLITTHGPYVYHTVFYKYKIVFVNAFKGCVHTNHAVISSGKGNAAIIIKPRNNEDIFRG